MKWQWIIQIMAIYKSDRSGIKKEIFLKSVEQAIISWSTVGTRVSAALLALEHNICNTEYLIGNMFARVDQTSALLSSSVAIPRGFTGRRKTTYNRPLANNLSIRKPSP